MFQYGLKSFKNWVILVHLLFLVEQYIMLVFPCLEIHGILIIFKISFG